MSEHQAAGAPAEYPINHGARPPQKQLRVVRDENSGERIVQFIDAPSEVPVGKPTVVACASCNYVPSELALLGEMWARCGIDGYRFCDLVPRGSQPAPSEKTADGQWAWAILEEMERGEIVPSMGGFIRYSSYGSSYYPTLDSLRSNHRPVAGSHGPTIETDGAVQP